MKRVKLDENRRFELPYCYPVKEEITESHEKDDDVKSMKEKFSSVILPKKEEVIKVKGKYFLFFYISSEQFHF